MPLLSLLDGILMGIDPGVSTGIAIRFPGGAIVTNTIDTSKTCSVLWDTIYQDNVRAVAFETFATGGRVDPNMIHTIELVGSIRGVCHVAGIRAFGQQPQARRSFIPDAATILQEQSKTNDHVYTKHEVDALAHLLLFEWRIKEDKL